MLVSAHEISQLQARVDWLEMHLQRREELISDQADAIFRLQVQLNARDRALADFHRRQYLPPCG